MLNVIKYKNNNKIKFIRLKRILFAIKHYHFLKFHWNIKYPFLNALFGNIAYDFTHICLKINQY